MKLKWQPVPFPSTYFIERHTFAKRRGEVFGPSTPKSTLLEISYSWQLGIGHLAQRLPLPPRPDLGLIPHLDDTPIKLLPKNMRFKAKLIWVWGIPLNGIQVLISGMKWSDDRKSGQIC